VFAWTLICFSFFKMHGILRFSVTENFSTS